jgi:hypothetical protein
MPDLVRYELRDGPHAGEPSSGRGEIERLARGCGAAACRTGVGRSVVSGSTASAAAPAEAPASSRTASSSAMGARLLDAKRRAGRREP